MYAQEHRNWINNTGQRLGQGNTYISQDETVPLGVAIRSGYTTAGKYALRDKPQYELFVSDVQRSVPRCYYLRARMHGRTVIFNAFIETTSLIPYLIRFGWELQNSPHLQNVHTQTPEREEPELLVCKPVYATPLDDGEQVIWYSTGMLGETYMEHLRWRNDHPTPSVVKFALFEQVGFENRVLS